MTKFILVILIILMCNSQCFAHQTITQILDTNTDSGVNITVTPGAITSTDIDVDTGYFASLLNPGFIVQANRTYQYQMYSTLQNSTGQEVYGMFEQGTTKYILLGNDGTAHANTLPTQTAIDNAKSSVPDPTLNGNVIAYPMSITINNTGVANFTSNHYDLNIKKKTTYVNLFVGTAPRDRTFGQTDYSGTYKATLYIDLLLD